MRYIIPLLLLLACRDNKQESATAPAGSIAGDRVHLTATQMEHIGIATGHPLRDTVNSVLRLQGTVDVPPHSIVSLSFPLGGYLKSTAMQPGMHVRKGQVLAILEDMQFIQLQQDYLTAKEKYALAETEFVRQRDLNASKASSDKVYQQAKTAFETERILVNALAQKLEVIGIRPSALNPETISREVRILSPIDGYVAKVNVNIGKYTSPTDNLFELIDPRDIHLALTVFEGDLTKIVVGQRVVAYTNANPDKKYEAHVIIGNKTLNEQRLAEIHCHFTNYNEELVPGMFMNGEVAIRSVDAITVPEEAVVRWDNRFYVFVEREPAGFDMVEVTPGVVEDGRQQITAPEVNPQTRVVTKNAYALLMKMRNMDEEG